MKKPLLKLLLLTMLGSNLRAQTVLDVQLPVVETTTSFQSSTNPADYVFSNTGNILQGVNIYLPPATSPYKPEIFMQQNNARLAVNVLYTSTFFASVEVNYDNTGFTSVYSGGSTQSYGWFQPPAWWTTMGTLHNLKVKYLDVVAAQWFTREYDIRFVKDAQEFHQDQISNNNFFKNKLTVWNDLTNANPKKAILMVEGYDALNTTNPEFYAYRAEGLINALQAQNYKVYVLDFAYNAQDMRNNAAVVHSAINYISSINNNQQIVVAGVSMGGVISRYCLAKDEQNINQNGGNYLPVSHFLSVDAPQQGAVISKKLLKFIKDNDDTNFSMSQPASLQLIRNNEFDGANPKTKEVFFNELNALNGNGYPTHCINVGLAFSRSTLPNPDCGQKWYQVTADFPIGSYTVKDFNVEDEECDAGSLLPVTTGQINDALFHQLFFPKIQFLQFGIHDVWVTTTKFLKNPTFIQHTSALDIINGESKFCIYFDLETNQQLNFHDIVPNELVGKIIGVLISTNLNNIAAGEFYNFINGYGNVINQNLSVYGNMAINRNLPGGPSQQPGGYPPSHSSYSVTTNKCNPVTIDVYNGAELNVGDNGIQTNGSLIIRNGSTLVLHSGSTMRIQQGCKVLIEPGAYLTIEPNVNIELAGNTSLLDVQGTFNNLSLASAQQITFTKASATTGGLAQFTNGLITMQTGSNFTNNGCRLKMFDVDYRHDATFVLQNNSVTDFKFSNDIILNAGETMPVLQSGAAMGGTLVLNSNDDVNHYRNFVLNSNATINNTGCKVRLIKYHFDYFQNGVINLTGDEAGLVFGGTINLNANADLHFNGSGYFGFRLEQIWGTYKNIFATPSSTITIIGTGKTDMVMNVEQNSWVHGNDDMGKFKVNDGKIIFDAGSQITLANPYELYQVSCEGSGNGLLLGGVDDHKIDRVDFIGLERGIRAVLAWGPIDHAGNALNITNSTFKNIGIQAIDVLGKGLNLTNCVFDENFAWNINASDMEFKSIFRNVTIRLTYDEMVNFTTSGLGTLTIVNSHFNSGYGVVYNGPNELTFKCSEINAWQGHNLTMGLDARLVASPQLTPRAGHTNFLSFNGSIFNDIKSLNIDGGHNNFTVNYVPPVPQPGQPPAYPIIMEGSIQYCQGHILARNNKWYDGNLAPLSPFNTHLTSSYLSCNPSKPLTVDDFFPADMGECPIEPQPPIDHDDGRVHPIVHCEQCPIVHVSGKYLPLNEAVKVAIDTLSDDTLRYDLVGINMLHEILTQSLRYDTYEINELSDLAYVRLKQALGNAYSYGLLRAHQGANTYTDKMLEMANVTKLRARRSDNDNAEFYSTVDEAAVYRMINDREKLLTY